MPNGNEMAGFYIDKLSLSQRLSIVSETYDRVNKNNKKEKLIHIQNLKISLILLGSVLNYVIVIIGS